MLAGKMKEIKKSVRRVYMRLFVLAAVVVFGAIAIAQAQKGKAKDELPGPDTVSFDDAAPIPLRSAAIDQSAATLVGYQDELPAAESTLEPIEAEPIEWESAELPNDLAADPLAEANTDLAPLDAEPYPEPTLPADDGQQFEQNTAYEQDGEFQSPELLEPELPSDTNVDPGFDPQPIPQDQFEAASPYEAAEDVPLPADEPADLQPLDALPTAAAAAAALEPYDNAPAALPDDRLMPEPVADQSQLEYGSSLDQPIEPIEPLNPAPSYEQNNVAFDQPAEERLDGASRISNPPTGKPGPQALEGPQSPALTLEKIAPTEIQVGQPTKFEIRVRNTGQITAENVLIRDEIPMGTNYVDSNPKATRATNGAVYWEIGAISPGEDVLVAMELMPTEEGQIGSVATVAFQASATARTNATKPELVIEQTGPREALLGETVRFSIKLSNPGSGAATEVVLEEDVPVGLSHSSGSKLEYEVGTIQPGQTRNLELTLKAAQAGPVVNTILAHGRGGLEARSSVELAVVAPKLQVEIDGPSKRYLDRQATFAVSIKNPGTSTASEVEVVAKLPSGLKFVSTNNSGYYDQSRHAVIWSLEQLPAGEMGKAQFTARPVEMGQYEVRAEGKSKSGLQASDDHAIAVEGIAALFFGLADQVDPIEIGGRTTYEIKVVNQGSKAASNVRIVALVPNGMKPLSAEGPTREQIQGQKVFFEPMGRLAPKGEALFRISVEGAEAGDHRFRVQMSSDDMTSPVIKEEGTRIYTD